MSVQDVQGYSVYNIVWVFIKCEFYHVWYPLPRPSNGPQPQILPRITKNGTDFRQLYDLIIGSDDLFVYNTMYWSIHDRFWLNSIALLQLNLYGLELQ